VNRVGGIIDSKILIWRGGGGLYFTIEWLVMRLICILEFTFFYLVASIKS
jgi:hypothetical protein